MIRQLPSELKQKATDDLHEIPDRIEGDIKCIRDWMTKQPHLSFQISDQLILTFMRCSKFHLEKAKKMIDNYYTMRSLAPEVFTNRDPLLPEMQLLLNAGVMIPLPKLDSNGCRILFCDYSVNINPETMSTQNISKLSYMISDILLLEDDHAVISGLKSFFNCKDADVKYLLQLNPQFLKKHTYIVEKGYPSRIKGLYFCNCASIYENAYRITKMFLSKKISARLVMCSKEHMQEFYKSFPQHLLPEEMGGENGSLQDLVLTWKKKVEDYREWFLKDEILKTDEKLRPVAPRTSSTEFGIEGSFRQLQID